MGTAPAASEGREPTLQDILRGAGGARLTPGPGGGPAAPAISPPASPSMIRGNIGDLARAPEQTGVPGSAGYSVPEQEDRVPSLLDILRGGGGTRATPGPPGPAAPAISPPASPSMRMARAPEQTGRIARAPEQEYRVREPALGGK
jgi:hypothetical protein